MPECFGFTLDNGTILAYDVDHPAPGPAPVPPPVQTLYDTLLFFVDRFYEGRAIERFWFLETVARMPYFAYTTCLHLYETLGWYRAAELRRIHFAEEWNELHHLLIMEAMGGDKRWVDRFLGQHAAVAYYWALVLVFFARPSWSYKFSEMLETHAVSTYGVFIAENEEKLARLPAPKIARTYYREGDLYMFDADGDLVRRAVGGNPRDAPCETMLDVFKNILLDELEHVKTMALCQDYDSLEKLVRFAAEEEGQDFFEPKEDEEEEEEEEEKEKEEKGVKEGVKEGALDEQNDVDLEEEEKEEEEKEEEKISIHARLWATSGGSVSEARSRRSLAAARGRKATSELLDPAARKKWSEWADVVNRDYAGPWLG